MSPVIYTIYILLKALNYSVFIWTVIETLISFNFIDKTTNIGSSSFVQNTVSMLLKFHDSLGYILEPALFSPIRKILPKMKFDPAPIVVLLISHIAIYSIEYYFHM